MGGGWWNRMALALAAVPASGVLVAALVLWHDAPKVYDVAFTAGPATAYLRVTPQHVVLGEWATADTVYGERPDPIWVAGPVTIVSDPWTRATEAAETHDDFTAAKSPIRLGRFGYAHGCPSFATSSRLILLPSWLLAALVLTPMGLVLVARHRRRRRTRAGRCVACGYDLRATPDRCPECGRPNPTSAHVTSLPT